MRRGPPRSIEPQIHKRRAVPSATMMSVPRQSVSSLRKRRRGMVPKELAATVFAVAIDLMLADGHLSANEQEFINNMRVLLNVDSETAARIVDVLTIKNAG